MFVTPPLEPEFFSNEYETLKNTSNLHLDSCSLSPFVEISLRFIHRAFFPFCDFTWLPPKSPFSTLLLENLDEVQRYSEILHLDDLCHHVCWILLYTHLHQVNHLVIYDPLTYLEIPHINVLRPLVILVIFCKINCTLTVAMKPN